MAADFPGEADPTAKRRRQPFGAGPDVRLRQVAAGAWEIGPAMADAQIRQERIRFKAHQLWEDAGRPWGQALDFWLAAERWDAQDGA